MQDQALDKRLIQLEEMLRSQQAELATLREALARKTAAALPPEPQHPTKPDPTRRQLLKRMGLAVLAGGAALGIASTSYAPAEARISVNPTAKIGAIITRNGASITGVPVGFNYGLLASAENPSFNSSTILTDIGVDVGVSGFSSTNSGSIGVLGYSNNGAGVHGSSSSGVGVRGNGGNLGVYGFSNTGYGVYGDSVHGVGVNGASSGGPGVVGASSGGPGVVGVSAIISNPGINALNNGYPDNGIALQIEKGGFTVKGAAVSSTTSSTAAFIHQTAAANITGNISKINNLLCNGRQDALLFVTHNFNPPSTSGTSELKAFGVYYLSGFWNIYHEDGSAMLADRYFNVLIINP